MTKLTADMQNLIEISKSPREAAERCAELTRVRMIKMLEDINRVSDRDGNRTYIRVSKLRMQLQQEGL
jgi:hypothetical protein